MSHTQSKVEEVEVIIVAARHQIATLCVFFIHIIIHSTPCEQDDKPVGETY